MTSPSVAPGPLRMPRPVSRSLGEARLLAIGADPRGSCGIAPHELRVFRSHPACVIGTARALRARQAAAATSWKAAARSRRTPVRVARVPGRARPGAPGGPVGRRSGGNHDVFDPRRPLRLRAPVDTCPLRRGAGGRPRARRTAWPCHGNRPGLARPYQARAASGVHRRGEPGRREPRHHGRRVRRGCSRPRACGGLSLPVGAERRGARRVRGAPGQLPPGRARLLARLRRLCRLHRRRRAGEPRLGAPLDAALSCRACPSRARR